MKVCYNQVQLQQTPAFKEKDQQSNQNLLQHYHHAKHQLNSSVHFVIWWILQYHEFKGHTHFGPYLSKNYRIKFQNSLIYISIQKIRLFHHFGLEINLIRKSCNLICSEPFGPYPRNQIFPKYGIRAGTQQKKNYQRTKSEKLKTKFSKITLKTPKNF